MIALSNIEVGDHVSFFCPRLRATKTRTVRLVDARYVSVFHGRGLYALAPEDIKSVTQNRPDRTNETALSKEMRRKNVTNADLADKSGYSTRAVCDARLGKKVRPVTLADITQALGEI